MKPMVRSMSSRVQNVDRDDVGTNIGTWIAPPTGNMLIQINCIESIWPILRAMTQIVEDEMKRMAQHPNCFIQICSPVSVTFMHDDFDSNVVAILRGDDVSCWVTQCPMKR